MPLQIYNWFKDTPPVFIDGTIYVLLAFCTAFGVALHTDNAAKYIDPKALFWLSTSFECSGAGLLALKMFRSTAYADHQQKKADTAFFVKTKESNVIT